MALAGWGPLLDRYTIYRIGRRQYPIGDDLPADGR